MNSIRRITLLAAGFALLTAACSGTDAATTTAPPAVQATTSSTSVAPTTATPTTTATSTTTTTTVPLPQLDLSFVELPFILQGTGHYEGWLIIDGQPVSTGKFTANSTGFNFADLNGDGIGTFPLDFDPSGATAFVLSIEPDGDTDPAPSDTHILAGDIIDGVADLSISHPAALGTDFADASGEFVLATPTDGDRTNDEDPGIWFLTFPGPTPGLVLPELPDGWTYEGWTVIDGTPVTTGTFLAVDRSDDAAPYSGTVRTPNFPGEDFLQNAPEGLTFPTNLSGATVVVSLEPLAEDNPLPFAVKPLAGPVPADAELEPVSYPLSNADFTAPTGRATIG